MTDAVKEIPRWAWRLKTLGPFIFLKNYFLDQNYKEKDGERLLKYNAKRLEKKRIIVIEYKKITPSSATLFLISGINSGNDCVDNLL